MAKETNLWPECYLAVAIDKNGKELAGIVDAVFGDELRFNHASEGVTWSVLKKPEEIEILGQTDELYEEAKDSARLYFTKERNEMRARQVAGLDVDSPKRVAKILENAERWLEVLNK